MKMMISESMIKEEIYVLPQFPVDAPLEEHYKFWQRVSIISLIRLKP